MSVAWLPKAGFTVRDITWGPVDRRMGCTWSLFITMVSSRVALPAPSRVTLKV